MFDVDNHIPYDAQPRRIENNVRSFEPVYAGLIETLDDTVGRQVPLE